MYREYLLVDGYNIIHAWEHLRKIMDTSSLENARDKLLFILSNFQGYRPMGIIVVFDAHKVKSGTGSVMKHGGLDVVYTAEAETADAYIERTTAGLVKKYKVRVATSDHLEQIIILSKGATRLSARELLTEIKEVEQNIRKVIDDRRPIKNNQFVDNLDPETAEILERMRRGEGYLR